MKRMSLVVLTIIVVITAIFRGYRFGMIPLGITPDEAALGYTSFLLLKTGQEEHGVRWPLKFESFGDWKQPGYIYMSLPIIAAFGLSTESVRLLSLLAGLSMIIVSYFAAVKIAGSHPNRYLAGVVTALFLAVNPWHFHSSHIAMEAFVASALFIAGFYFLMKRNTAVFIIGLLFLLAGIETYHAALVFIPLWFGCYVLLNYKEILGRKIRIAAVAGFLTIIAGLYLQSWFSSERAKVSGTAVFSMSNERLWQEIYQYRDNSLQSKLVHNLYVYSAAAIARNYVNDFASLFLTPDNNDTFPGYPNLLYVEVILAVIGGGWAVKSKNKWGMLAAAALLLSLVPGAITKGVRTNRLLFILPQIQILAALGLMVFFKILHKKEYRTAAAAVVAAAALYQAVPFYYYYFTVHNKVENPYFADYMQDISYFVKQHQHEYKTIYFTYPYESPYIFFSFYNRVDPKTFLREIEYYPVDDLGFRYAKRMGNLEFIPSTRDLEQLPKAHLEQSLVISRVAEAKKISPIKTWYDAGGRPQIVAFNANMVLK